MRIAVLLLFLFTAQNSFGQSDSSRYSISLLTCAAGNELYSIFGHTAIRVVDHVRKKDEVYNYGIFDFDTPFFYVKFFRGQLKYKLGKQTFRGFLREYEYYKRDVIENKFNLSPAEARKMVGLLAKNYRPENRYYSYDFFFDNCASRIRDMMESTIGEQIEGKDPFNNEMTYRQLLDRDLKNLYWADFGIDLILGSTSDKIVDFRGQMFLPYNLKENMLQAKRVSDNQPILFPDKEIYTFPSLNPPGKFWIKPVFWTTLLFLVLALLTFFGIGKRALRIFDGIFFTINGLVGTLFLLMWLTTNHIACWANWNMLWAFPLNLLMGWTLFKSQLSNFSRNYFHVVALLIAIGLVGWLVIPQEFHLAVLPLMLTLLLRLVFRILSMDGKRFFA